MTSLIVPQAMSYATSLAGIDPVNGLFGAAIPALVCKDAPTSAPLSAAQTRPMHLRFSSRHMVSLISTSEIKTSSTLNETCMQPSVECGPRSITVSHYRSSDCYISSRGSARSSRYDTGGESQNCDDDFHNYHIRGRHHNFRVSFIECLLFRVAS